MRGGRARIPSFVNWVLMISVKRLGHIGGVLLAYSNRVFEELGRYIGQAHHWTSFLQRVKANVPVAVSEPPPETGVT